MDTASANEHLSQGYAEHQNAGLSDWNQGEREEGGFIDCWAAH